MNLAFEARERGSEWGKGVCPQEGESGGDWERMAGEAAFYSKCTVEWLLSWEGVKFSKPHSEMVCHCVFGL